MRKKESLARSTSTKSISLAAASAPLTTKSAPLAAVKIIPLESTHIGLVGAGASTIYLRNNILNDLQTHGSVTDLKLSLFEKGSEMGVNMPYNAKIVDTVHIVNVLPEETPELLCTYTPWLKTRTDTELMQIGIQDKKQISESLLTWHNA